MNRNFTPNFTSDIEFSNFNFWVKWTYVAAFGASSLGGILGNITIVWAFAASRKLRSWRNAFILNLSTADLAVAGVTMPMSIIGVLVGRAWHEERHYLCLLSAMICAPGCVATTYSIFAVAAGRYYYICQYGFYLKYFTAQHMIAYIILIWLISFLIHLPNHVGWGKVQYSSHFQFCTFDSDHEHYSYAYASVLGVAIALTAIYYGKMYLKIRSSNLPRRLMLERKPSRKCTCIVPINEANHVKSSFKSTEPKIGQLSLCATPKMDMNQSDVPCTRVLLTSASNFRMRKLRDELRLINASFKIFLFFLFFWAPVIVILLFFRNRIYYNVPDSVYLFSALLAHSNSTCNVFIYYGANNAFRKFARRLWQKFYGFLPQVVKIVMASVYFICCF